MLRMAGYTADCYLCMLIVYGFRRAQINNSSVQAMSALGHKQPFSSLPAQGLLTANSGHPLATILLLVLPFSRNEHWGPAPVDKVVLPEAPYEFRFLNVLEFPHVRQYVQRSEDDHERQRPDSET